MDHFKVAEGEDGTWRGNTAKEQRILNALSHAMRMDSHSFDPIGCWGCRDIAAWLTYPGYTGWLQPPLVH